MLIVTPNPAIDHTIRLAALRPGEVIRTGIGVSVAGGKGGNVARAARCLGTHAAVLAFVPEIGSEHLAALYGAEGFELLGVPTAGRVRTCTAMLEDTGRVTLLNEPGAAVDGADWHRLRDAVAARLADPATRPPVIVCSGSLPPGAPADGYAQIVDAGHDAGCEVIVDASGEVLVHAVAHGADLVCPNVAEAERAIVAMTASGHGAGTNAAGLHAAEPVDDDGPDVPDRARRAATRLRDLGAHWALVTAGSAGAALAGPRVDRFFAAPRVAAVNPIGAGDSLVAGLATARLAGRDWPSAARRGLAGGSASVEQERAGVVDPARVDELERQVVGA